MQEAKKSRAGGGVARWPMERGQGGRHALVDLSGGWNEAQWPSES